MVKKTNLNFIGKLASRDLESRIRRMELVVDRVVELLASGELEIKAGGGGVVGGEDEGRVIS